MKYGKTVSGTFIDRPNRFIAHVEIEGKCETVHVKNTGRCRELLLPGSTVILEDFRNTKAGEKRKTAFDLISVYKKIEPSHPLYRFSRNGKLLINMDSQAPNRLAMEWLESLPQEESFSFIKPEYTYGKSRIDFYMEKHAEESGGIQKYLMEVKGWTLEKNGTGYFPDAPTGRGVNHVHELTEAVRNGYSCILAFVIQVPGVQEVLPNIDTHPEFAEALENASAAGVMIRYIKCTVKEDEVLCTFPQDKVF